MARKATRRLMGRPRFPPPAIKFIMAHQFARLPRGDVQKNNATTVHPAPVILL